MNTDYLAIKHGVLFIINSDYPVCVCVCVCVFVCVRGGAGIELLLIIR